MLKSMNLWYSVTSQEQGVLRLIAHDIKQFPKILGRFSSTCKGNIN